MGVRKRDESSGWQVDFRWKGQRIRKDFPTKEEAEKWEAGAKAALFSGRTLPGQEVKGSKTMREAVDYTYEQKWKQNKSAEIALRNAEIVIELIGPETPCAELTQDMIDAAKSALMQRTKGKRKLKQITLQTVNRKFAALRTVLILARKRGWMTEQLDLPRFDEPDGVIRYISIEEEAKILEWADRLKKTLFKDVYTVLCDTGIRCGVLKVLRTEWLVAMPGGRMMLVIPGWVVKNKVALTIPLTGRAKEVLTRRSQAAENGVIFPRSIYNYDKMRWAWAKMLRDTKISFARIHDLRHTFCSRLVQMGVPLTTVQKLAGHRRSFMTERYSHLAPKNLDSAIDKLDQGIADGTLAANNPMVVVANPGGHNCDHVTTPEAA